MGTSIGGVSYLARVFPARVCDRIGAPLVEGHVVAFIYPDRVDVYNDRDGGSLVESLPVCGEWFVDQGVWAAPTADGNLVGVLNGNGCNCGPLRSFEPEWPPTVAAR